MSNGYVIPIDPGRLASHYPSHEPSPDDYEEEGSVEPLETVVSRLLETSECEQILAPLLELIPEREADLIHLYYIDKKRQADIAEIFHVTQAAISYRLDRGLKRIKFLLSIPRVTEEDMRRDLLDVPLKQIDIDILVGMWRTTCQSEVATRLGLTQGRVRHRFFKAVRTLTEAAQRDEKFKPYYSIFNSISDKGGKGGFNILREVKLPQWSHRGDDECF